MVLNDDYNGKDLSDCLAMLRKIEYKKNDYSNINGDNILNIECTDVEGKKYVFLNGKYVEPNDKNLPFFSYVARLTKKIASMDSNNMSVSQDYIASNIDKTLIYGKDLKKSASNYDEFKKMIPLFFDPQVVKHTARQFNNFVQKIMNNYFGV